MLFEETRYKPKEVWQMLQEDREGMRGKHEILRFLFPDLDEPYYAVASDGKNVVIRTVHYPNGHLKVVFMIYSRLSYYNSEKNHVKGMLDRVNN